MTNPSPPISWTGDLRRRCRISGGSAIRPSSSSASSGKLYLAAVLDLFSRFVVGWAVSAVNDRHLTIKALEMALKRRCPEIGLLHHSDQGCTYASEDYQSLLDGRGIVCSMSRRGNCYDNAVMESFFSTVKTELTDHFDSCGEAKMALFDYIEVFYNQRRRHSTIGQISPAAYERRANEEGMDAMENRTGRGFPPRPHPSVLLEKKNEDRLKQRSQPVHRIGSGPRRHLNACEKRKKKKPVGLGLGTNYSSSP